MTSSNDVLVLAGLSVRALAEMARAEGFVPIALDLFGDRDTRAVSDWRCIGREGVLAIDRSALMDALSALARERSPIGWIAGSGFEAQPGLLAEAADLLPLIGNTPALSDEVRTPECFYPLLSELGIPHAETRLHPPADLHGWLVKNARACGGWHVREAALASAGGSAGCYFQRQLEGEPMSVLFIADGSRFVRLGVASLRVGPVAVRRWVFRGAVTASVPGSELAGVLDRAIGRLVSTLGLAGLNGIDFILNEDGPHVIELNPRPTASISLFRDVLAGGLLRAHLAACSGLLPVLGDSAGGRPTSRGFEVVFAHRPVQVDATLADWIAGCGWCADQPAAGAALARHDPVCTIVAEASSRNEIERLLIERSDTLRARLNACAGKARA